MIEVEWIDKFMDGLYEYLNIHMTGLKPMFSTLDATLDMALSIEAVQSPKTPQSGHSSSSRG